MDKSKEALLRMEATSKRVALPPSSIYALVAKGEFPPPVNLGGRQSACVESEIDAWVETRIARRDKSCAA